MLADEPLQPAPPDEDGLLTWLFEPESFAPLARVSEQRGAMAVFTDHLGTPLCLTDDAGALVWQATTDTYGHCTVTAGDPALCPWRFPGQYQDPETDLFYNRFRYYDPHVGTYISRDPIGLAGGLAVHGYVDDPLGWVDPFGLAKKKGGCGSEAAPGTGSGSSGKGKRFSSEKQALVDMAKKDKKTGITPDDMKAYKDLNLELPDPFPSNKVRGPEAHPNRPHGKQPHGHVGPVDHIPIPDSP
ncbi:MAG: RHS repeat-associated core domain-containing protein [Myxococcota bacterium]